MKNKKLRSFIITISILLVITILIIIFINFVNKPKEVVIYDINESGTLLKYNGKEQDVVIPKEVKSIGKEAFLNSTSTKTITFEKGTAITDISTKAFKGCIKLSSIELPDTIEKIGSFAFNKCTALTNVTLPANLTKLEDYAFDSCSLLASVIINNKLVSIGDYAFAKTSINALTLPATLTSIGKGFVNGCEDLEFIMVDSNNQNFKIYNESLYSFDHKELIVALGIDDRTYTIDSNVEKIRSYAFYNTKEIRVLNVGENVKKIEPEAFSGCSNLNTITVPFIGTQLDTTTSNEINDGAFDIIFGSNVPSNLQRITITKCSRIVERAFQNFAKLTTVTYPVDTVQAIGFEAFYGCSALTNFVLPTNLKVIEKGTFTNCSSLITINIPNSVNVIENEAFKGCTNLQNFVVPNTVYSIGEGTFSGCEDLKSITLPFIGKGYEVNPTTGEKASKAIGLSTQFGYIFGSTAVANMESTEQSYNGITANYYLPKQLTSVTITGNENINDFAFSGCSKITNIQINDQVKLIGKQAFSKSGITDFIAPESLETIEVGAFQDCTKLINFDLGLNLITIKENAFFGCKNLTAISLPDTVQTIETSAFSGCKKITTINFNNVSFLGDTVLYDCAALTSITISPDNANYKVENGTLYSKDGKLLIYYLSTNANVTFTVPNTVETIKSQAFVNCKKLVTVIINENVTNLNNYIFVNATKLENLTLPYLNNSIDNLFSLEKPLKLNVTILKGEIIKANTFLSCNYLNSISVPDEVKEIQDSAFDRCVNLTTIQLPASLEKIGKYSFSGCQNLTEIIIPSTVSSIDSYAFNGCSKLNSINIPDRLEELGKCVFKNCFALSTISISSGNTLYSLEDQILYSNSGKTLLFFLPTQPTTTLNIKNTVEEIDSYAFSGSSNLETVVIPDSVIKIGDGVFANCPKLISVTLPKNSTVINSSMFEDCVALKSINNSDKIERIEAKAFKGCLKLETIPVSELTTYIGLSAFEQCEALREVTLPKLFIELNDNMFSGCISLEKVRLSDQVISIGNNVFNGCSKLENLIFYDKDNNDITRAKGEIFFNASLKSIGDNAFKECNSLIIIIFNEGLESIGSSAFSTCRYLATIYVPESVITIGEEGLGSLFSGNIYSNAITVTIGDDKQKTYTYPETWAKTFNLNTLKTYGKNEFTIVDGVPQAK